MKCAHFEERNWGNPYLHNFVSGGTKLLIANNKFRLFLSLEGCFKKMRHWQHSILLT